MNFKKLFRFWLNPRFIIRNNPINLTVDRFIRLLIEHKDEVELVKCDSYTATIGFRGVRYQLWIANFPYAYLSDIWLDNNGMFGNKISSNVMPSRETIFDFHETFDEAFKAMTPPLDGLSILRKVIDGEER